MEKLKKLMEDIDMPAEAAERVLAAELPFSADQTEALSERLTDKDRYKEAAQELSAAEGFAQLRVFLCAALKTRIRYAEKGIPDEIFVQTMKCFSRFVGEHRASCGEYGFDRGFWVGRQLSLLLFRLGELEYECADYEGEKALSVHIPSDADLTPEKLDRSFAAAREFFAKYGDGYAEAKFFCYSWLLAPALGKLLPPTSKIALFQRRFKIVKTDQDSAGYIPWVFKKHDLKPEDFPENTTLQKNMKAFVLSGGKVGEALGVIE